MGQQRDQISISSKHKPTKWATRDNNFKMKKKKASKFPTSKALLDMQKVMASYYNV